MAQIAATPSGLNFGVFCGGKAGVDLNRLFLSFTYVRKIGNVSFGIAPRIAGQAFKAWGLNAFDTMSVTANTGAGSGYSYSPGYGLRAGVQANVTPGPRIGISAQTKMQMGKLKKYASLFEEVASIFPPRLRGVSPARHHQA